MSETESSLGFFTTKKFRTKTNLFTAIAEGEKLKILEPHKQHTDHHMHTHKHTCSDAQLVVVCENVKPTLNTADATVML